MKFSFICLLVVLAISAVFAKSAASTQAQAMAVSKADVTLSQADLQEYGVPPRVYTYNFRKCYYCKYACAFQFPFVNQQTNHTSCGDSCQAQDYCQEWVKPVYKDTVTPYAVAWRQVTLPVDLALSLNLATSTTCNTTGTVTYKPTYVPYPWMCATPVEYITPEYKPEPVAPVCWVTPTFNTATFASPVHALQMYLSRKIIKTLNLAPFTGHQVVYFGN